MTALLTPWAVARRLNVSDRTVVRWLRDGHLRGHKFSKEWRVSEFDLDQFLVQSANRRPLSEVGRTPLGGISENLCA